MFRRINDWKDIADSYYEKSLCLAILMLLFSFLGFTRMDVKPYDKEVKMIQSIEIHTIPAQPIPPPRAEVRPQIDIVLESEEILMDKDIEIVATIPSSRLDDWIPPTTNQSQHTKYANFQEPPVALKQIAPIYPKWAKISHIEGIVQVEAEVLANGKVGEINVLHSIMTSPNDFDEAAIKAVKQWEFQPAMSNGKAVVCWVKLDIVFHLK
jgi:TonB family protein